MSFANKLSYEDAVSLVKATSQATAEEFKQLSKLALQLGKDQGSDAQSPA